MRHSGIPGWHGLRVKSSRPRSGNKEVQQFLDEYYEAGWTITMAGSGSWKLTAPNGLASGFCAATPSDRRAFQNMHTDLKKVLRLSQERAAQYEPPTPPEEKAYRQKKDEKAMQTLRHSPFAVIAAKESIAIAREHMKPHSLPIPKPLPAPVPLAKPDMNVQTARARVQELVKNGKSIEDAATVVTTAFNIVSGFGGQVTLEGLIHAAGVPFNAGKNHEEQPAKEAKVTQPKPEKAVRKAHTDKEIDEKLGHVRSILTLPFDKDKKMTLIIDLLQELL